MSFTFLAPILLAGLALPIVPWLIHQIRRPERETVVFSSLMFVPSIKQKIIERRTIQHLLLMLLRMLLLILLAFAFSRPSRILTTPAPESVETGRSVILIDTSYSMGVGDQFQEAKEEALSIARSLGPLERAGVIAFNDRPVGLAPLTVEGESIAANHSRIQQAIEKAELSGNGTSYLTALQAAQDLLLSGFNPENPSEEKCVVYLISDFQKTGMPETDGRWKLSPRISLQPISIGTAVQKQFSVVDVIAQASQAGSLRIAGRIRNQSTGAVSPCTVKLFIDDAEAARQSILVQPGNTSKISFDLPIQTNDFHEGYLELEEDALNLDNRRYFAWNPSRKKRIVLIADPRPETRWPGAWFLTRALQVDADIHWDFKVIQQDELTGIIDESPDILLAGDLDGLTKQTAETLLRFTREGKSVFLCLNASMKQETINENLLSAFGLKHVGFRDPTAHETPFELLSWIDFDHPIFFPFQGSQYNDFSSIHFTNYVRIESIPSDEDAGAYPVVKTLARFESDVPAILEIPYGKGMVLLWTFPLELEWTNLMRSPKFLPLLFESLQHLAGREEEHRAWQVGERVTAAPEHVTGELNWSVHPPGEDSSMRFESANSPILLEKAGFLRWRSNGAPEENIIEAVNVDAKESDLTRAPFEEFEGKLCAASFLDRETISQTAEGEELESDLIITDEFGRFFLILFFIGLLMECWYAFRLSKKASSETA